MLSRLAGRLVTGPLAFFLATVVDVLVFAIASLLQRLAKEEREWRS
jgi:hypothetical protein